MTIERKQCAKTFVSLHTLQDDSVSLVSQNKQVVRASEERHAVWTGVQVKTFAGEKGSRLAVRRLSRSGESRCARRLQTDEARDEEAADFPPPFIERAIPRLPPEGKRRHPGRRPPPTVSPAVIPKDMRLS